MRSLSMLLPGSIAGILIFLLLTFAACKDGSSTGPDPNSPSEENISASFEGDGSFVPGQFGEISIEGTSLSSDVYDATINDTEIELSSGPEDTTDNEALFFITPALPAGTHQMDITIEDQSTSLDVTIEEYEVINKPAEYIDGYISTIKSRLDTYSSDTDTDELKTWLEDILTNLSSSAENISNLDGASMQQLAYILRENISIKSDELPPTPKGCNEAQNRIDTSAGVSEEILILLKWGSANSLPGYDQTGNTIVVNLTRGAFADPVAQVQTAYAVALKQCISEPVTQLEKAEQLKEKPTYTQLAETQSLDFFPSQSEAFYIRSTFTPPDELLIAIENFLASQEPLMEFIPESVRTYFLEPPEELTQMRDPELFNIENISLGSVQHSQETDGDEIIMAFSYKQGQDPDEPQIFTFELADQENPDYPAQVEANLDVNDFDINLEFEGGQSDFLPGRLAVINQEAVTLDKESYDGLIDGEQLVDLAASEDGNGQLLFQIPELFEGQHTLKIRLAGRKVAIDFSVKSYPSIDDPETYTNGIIDQTDGKLEAIQNETENQQVADRIQQVRNDLADSRSEFKELSAEKKKMVARTIKTNIESFTDNISSKAVTASFDAEKCTDLAGVLIGEKILIERGLKAIIATSYTSIVFGPVAAAVVAGVGIGKFIQSTQKVLDTYQEALDACLSDPVRTLQEDLTNTKSAKTAKTAGSTLSSTTLSFTHDESKDFYVQTTYTVFEEIRIAYNDYLALLDPLFEYLPGEWKSKLENSKTELTQVDDPGRFSISGISKSSISAEIQSKSEQIDLTFLFKQGQMPDSRQSFSFILNDSELPDNPTTFEATLEPVDLPKVADQHITINKNETYNGELTGESTDEFEIVETVQYGELTLNDPQSGSFTYTPAENLVTKVDHPDSFTYRGINDNGADTAQVTIQVKDLSPVAYDDQFTVEMNSYYEGNLRADNADEFVIVDSTENGELDLNQVNGDFRYTPNQDYNGNDRFTFKALNEEGESEIAELSIHIDEVAPIAFDMNFTTNVYDKLTNKKEEVTIRDTLTADYANRFQLVDPPTLGHFEFVDDETGAFIYTPNFLKSGTDEFSFTGSNQKGNSNLAAVRIEIVYNSEIPQNCSIAHYDPTYEQVMRCTKDETTVYFEGWDGNEDNDYTVHTIRSQENDPDSFWKWEVKFDNGKRFLRTTDWGSMVRDDGTSMNFSEKSGYFTDRMNSSTDFKPERRITENEYYSNGNKKSLKSIRCRNLETASEENIRIHIEYASDGFTKTYESRVKNIPPGECPTYEDILDVLPMDDYNPYEDSYLYRINNIE